MNNVTEVKEPQAFWINPFILSTKYFSPCPSLLYFSLSSLAEGMNSAVPPQTWPLTSDTVSVAEIDPMFPMHQHVSVYMVD